MRALVLLLCLSAAANAYWWPLARRQSVCSTVTPTSYIGLDSSVLGSTADVVAVDTSATPLCSLSPTDALTRTGITRGVWHVFRGTGESVSLSTASPNTNFNTALHLFVCSGSSGCAAYNDDCGGETAAALSFVSDADTIYYVLVTGFEYSSDMYELSLSSSGSACAVELNTSPVSPFGGWLGGVSNNDNYGGWTSLTGGKSTSGHGSFAGSLAGGSFAGSLTSHKTGGFTHIGQTTKSPFAGTNYPYATTNYPYATTHFQPSSSSSSSSSSSGETPCQLGVHAQTISLHDHVTLHTKNAINLPSNIIGCGNYGYEIKGFWLHYVGEGEWVTATTDRKTTTINTSIRIYTCEAYTNNCAYYDEGGCTGQAVQGFMGEKGTDYYLFVSNEINSYDQGTIEFILERGYLTCGQYTTTASSNH